MREQQNNTTPIDPIAQAATDAGESREAITSLEAAFKLGRYTVAQEASATARNFPGRLAP